jgi:hypothetical protein
MTSVACTQHNQRRQGSLHHAPRPVLSREARSATNTRRQEARTAYTNSIQLLASDIKDKISCVAAEHKKSYNAVEDALNLGLGLCSKGKHTKASAWHAFLWKKGQIERENGGKTRPGMKWIKLTVVHKDSISRDELSKTAPMRSPEYHNLTPEEKEQYVKEYEEWRTTRQVGEWVSSQSKTRDVLATVKRVESEVRDWLGWLPYVQ